MNGYLKVCFLLNRFEEPSKSDWIKTVGYVLIAISIISFAAFLLLPLYWYAWIVIIGVILMLIVRWHSNIYGYRCGLCGHEFEISTLTNLVSPHGITREKPHSYGWTYLECPNCHRSSQTRIVKKVV